MCGICGWFDPNYRGPLTVIDTMNELLHHRGPDDGGSESGDGWSLGFRRLSILDLSPLGRQPMRSPDGRFRLVFNGEIYNYVELRRTLEQAGERFQGGSDTEVLLRLLMRHGKGALPLLNGMYAFAFIDTHARTFLLARDRLGVKPLYYCFRNGGLRFASELKALWSWPDAEREIDRAAVAQYISIGYLPSETCIFTRCFKLPPGHLLSGRLDRVSEARVESYWELRLNTESSGNPAAATDIDELEHLLVDAVRIRLRSDVPVGIFLSGGLDSGIVAAVAAQVSERKPLALTVGFSESDCDESDLARATAQHVGLEHRVIVQEAGGLHDIDRLAWFYDEPFGDPSALPTFTLSQAAATQATVFLSGDGGDEAFGGYRRYLEAARRQRAIESSGMLAWALRALGKLVPELSLARYQLLKLSLPDSGCAAVFDDLPTDPAIGRLMHPGLRALLDDAARPVWERWSASRGACLTARQRSLDYALYLPDDVLVKVDRASMAHSIEVRSPFLDFRVVEWAARLTRDTLLNRQEGKLPLRMLGARLLPTNVLVGHKRGFGVPLDDWFRTRAGLALVQERLLSRRALELGFWDAEGVKRIAELHYAARGRHFGLLLWRLLMLEAWARHYATRPTLSAAVARRPNFTLATASAHSS